MRENPSPFCKLSAREIQIAQCLLEGLKTKEIGLKLKIKSNTVSTVKRTMFFKLGVANLVDFLKLAMNQQFQ